jgi:mRNA (2'-O-methyladenosine-N6-)-methyltransferase
MPQLEKVAQKTK